MADHVQRPPRHVPRRTCIGCRQEAGKRELVRIVRTPEQRLAVDPTGRANGRGAYLHATRVCWEKALKGSTISHALKFNPAREDVEALRAFAVALPAEESEDS
ncbi:MAG: YlxR family protein [Dehalococcoidia bacterium]|nr:YlxR family protein [Dehalococcoidia bacterium]